jgi:hypothetical protein
VHPAKRKQGRVLLIKSIIFKYIAPFKFRPVVICSLIRLSD